MTTMTEQTTQVYSVFIRATPEQVWDAITKPEFTTRYFYGSAVDSTFERGAPFFGWSGDRQEKLVDGEVLDADPPRLLRHTWRALYDPETAAEPHSRVTGRSSRRTAASRSSRSSTTGSRRRRRPRSTSPAAGCTCSAD